MKKKTNSYPTIEVEIVPGKPITIPKFVTLSQGRLLWEDPHSEIVLNIGDFDKQYVELKPEMGTHVLSTVIRALVVKTLIPFNPDKDILPYNRGNQINPKADLSVLRNDDAWNILQAPERQVIQEIRRTKDKTTLERIFKYESRGMNPLAKSRVNVVDELVTTLRKKGSRIHDSLIRREEEESIAVKT